MNQPIFEIYQEVNGKYTFRLRAVNNEIVAIGGRYKTKTQCINGIKEHLL